MQTREGPGEQRKVTSVDAQRVHPVCKYQQYNCVSLLFEVCRLLGSFHLKTKARSKMLSVK